MGVHHSYDCIQQHPYYIGKPKVDTLPGGLADFFVYTAARMIALGAQVEHTQSLIARNAGANAGKVGMLLSEFGQLGTFPDFSRRFARSEGQAVMNALALQEFALRHAVGADRTALTDYTFGAMPPELAAVQASDAQAAKAAMNAPDDSTAGDFALFAGPGPNTVVTPPALVTKLMRAHLGGALVSSRVERSPTVASCKGDKFDALQVLTSRDADGSVHVVVINVDPNADVAASVSGFAHGPQLIVETLASPNINDENTPEHPNLVAIVAKQIDVGASLFTFPKHSVTAIVFSPK